MSLTFRADPGSLRLVVKASSGRLLSASAPPFLAGSAGALIVAMQSTGAISSHFTVSVLCPPQAAILPVPARDLSVAAGANASAAFSLLPTASTAAASGACDVVLVSAIGEELDRIRVSVNQTEAPRVISGQGGTHTGSNGNGAGADTSNATSSGGLSLCGSRCSSWFDLACAVTAASSCVKELAGWSTGLGLGALLFALVALKQPALLLAPLRAVAHLCCGARSGAKEREDDAAAAAAAAAPAAAAPAVAQPRPRPHPRPRSRSRSPTRAKRRPPTPASPSPSGPALVDLLQRSGAPELSARRVVVDVSDDDPRDDAPAAPPQRGRHHHKHRERRES